MTFRFNFPDLKVVYVAGVKFKEWKAKDGECDKCSEGGGGPFVIEGKCEADSSYSCKGVKNTKETDECVKYCDSSAGRMDKYLIQNFAGFSNSVLSVCLV